MKLKISIVGGPRTGDSFEMFAGDTLVFGRGQQSDTRIDDPTISRVHCEIAHHGKTIAIADRGSSSGTFVNGSIPDNKRFPSVSNSNVQLRLRPIRAKIKLRLACPQFKERSKWISMF